MLNIIDSVFLEKLMTFWQWHSTFTKQKELCLNVCLWRESCWLPQIIHNVTIYTLRFVRVYVYTLTYASSKTAWIYSLSLEKVSILSTFAISFSFWFFVSCFRELVTRWNNDNSLSAIKFKKTFCVVLNSLPLKRRIAIGNGLIM